MLFLRKRFSKKKKIICPKDVLFKTKSFKKKKIRVFFQNFPLKKCFFSKMSLLKMLSKKKNVFFFSLIWKTKFFKKKMFSFTTLEFLKRKKKVFWTSKDCKRNLSFHKKNHEIFLGTQTFSFKNKNPWRLFKRNPFYMFEDAFFTKIMGFLIQIF